MGSILVLSAPPPYTLGGITSGLCGANPITHRHTHTYTNRYLVCTHTYTSMGTHTLATTGLLEPFLVLYVYIHTHMHTHTHTHKPNKTNIFIW